MAARSSAIFFAALVTAGSTPGEATRLFYQHAMSRGAQREPEGSHCFEPASALTPTDSSFDVRSPLQTKGIAEAVQYAKSATSLSASLMSESPGSSCGCAG